MLQATESPRGEGSFPPFLSFFPFPFYYYYYFIRICRRNEIYAFSRAAPATAALPVCAVWVGHEETFFAPKEK